jgi:hypothetical protein
MSVGEGGTGWNERLEDKIGTIGLSTGEEKSISVSDDRINRVRVESRRRFHKCIMTSVQRTCQEAPKVRQLVRMF